MNLNNFSIREETFLKAYILTHGVSFSEKCLNESMHGKCKQQNLIYNMPLNASAIRPQELIITNKMDNYSVVVSCVAEHEGSNPVFLDIDSHNAIFAKIENKIIPNITIDFVKEPNYYSKELRKGVKVKKYVSACGLDELNIVPWKGCALSKKCSFCGINNFIDDMNYNAFTISDDYNKWNTVRDTYLKDLKRSIHIASKDSCYKEHMHTILISGNLKDKDLDFETDIFCEIANYIKDDINELSDEGIILVITPPKDMKKIDMLKESGIRTVVFNLEAIIPEYQKMHCPGKYALGNDFFKERLLYATKIFEKGHTWSNLVLGLEPIDEMLPLCEYYARNGVVLSANVLHLDKGNTTECLIPTMADVVKFFYELERINTKYGFLPYYCSKALRTSLSNEVHDYRIVRR